MKVKVLTPFRDRHTGKEHKKGDVIEVTAKRFCEIEKTHYIQPVEEQEQAKETNEKK